MITFIDIETIPDQTPGAVDEFTANIKAPAQYKKPESIAKWIEDNKHSAGNEAWLKTSFDGGRGQIACICLAFENSSAVELKGSENEILHNLNSVIKNHAEFTMVEPSPYFVGHFISGFDLPFLHKRFIVSGIKPSFKLKPHGRHGQHFFDTMVEWCGYKGSIKMDALAKLLGVQGKTQGMDGSQVWPEYQKGNIDKIVDYCADDVECVRAIYNKLNFIAA